ncbi:hypothetical protein MP228_007563 [Amoeboaphelidium protococcarum]|nr:hypothetical protein MP228_007563 [Amoeboaphelidium protococcarum]
MLAAVLKRETGAISSKTNIIRQNAAKQVFEFNAKQKSVYERIQRGESLVLLGQAGSGKSLLIKKCMQSIEGCRVICPTGISAVNLMSPPNESEGSCVGDRVQTIHAFANIPPQLSVLPVCYKSRAERTHELRQVARNLYHQNKIYKHVMKRVRDTKLLIVDEVGMVHPDTLDILDHYMRYVKRQSTKPFGGVQVVLSGDLLQLPPVVRQPLQTSSVKFEADQETRDLLLNGDMDQIMQFNAAAQQELQQQAQQGKSEVAELQQSFCFESTAWKRLGIHTLQQNMRTDQLLFHQLLNYLRSAKYESLGDCDIYPVVDSILHALQTPLWKRRSMPLFNILSSDLCKSLAELLPFVKQHSVVDAGDDGSSQLNRYRFVGELMQFDKAIAHRDKQRFFPHQIQHVYPLNSEADSWNNKMLADNTVHSGDICRLEALHELRQQDGTLVRWHDDQNKVQKSGLTFSLLPEIRLRLGAKIVLTRNLNVNQGLVNGAVGIVKSIQSDCIHVKLQGCGGQFGGESERSCRNNIVKLEKVSEEEPIQCSINGQFINGTLIRRQFPLRLAYATTIHKVQGKSLDSLHVSLRNTFECGQVYCGISRCTNLQGLLLSGYDDIIGYSNTVVRDKIWQSMHHPRIIKYQDSVFKTFD